METVSFAYHTVLDVGFRMEIAADGQLAPVHRRVELTADCWEAGAES